MENMELRESSMKKQRVAIYARVSSSSPSLRITTIFPLKKPYPNSSFSAKDRPKIVARLSCISESFESTVSERFFPLHW